MKRNQEKPRIAVVCMVYNGDEYISEFLLYHLMLVDHIFLIDHKSHRDLRDLDLSGVTVVRSNHVAQFQSECTNLVIDHFDIRNQFDWLFVLDIDEFLPFKTKDEFYIFLRKWSRSKVLHFTWQNGVPLFPDEDAKKAAESLVDCNLHFHKKENATLKVFVNIRKTGQNFYVQTGAHQVAKAKRPIYTKINRLKMALLYKSVPTGMTLFHVVSFDKEKFVEKIQNYIRQMEMRSHVVGQGGWMVRDYPTKLDGEEWLWYVANFRLSDKRLHHRARAEDYEPVAIFDHLSRDEIRKLRQTIRMFPEVEKQPQSELEKKYFIYKTDDTQIQKNLRWFDITAANEIVSVQSE